MDGFGDTKHLQRTYVQYGQVTDRKDTKKCTCTPCDQSVSGEFCTLFYDYNYHYHGMQVLCTCDPYFIGIDTSAKQSRDVSGFRIGCLLSLCKLCG